MVLIKCERWKDDLIVALNEIIELQKQVPHVTALGSAHAQLIYLIALADGTETDDSRLEEIMIGRLAVYQLAGIISFKLSELLCDIEDKVDRYLRRRGRCGTGGNARKSGLGTVGAIPSVARATQDRAGRQRADNLNLSQRNCSTGVDGHHILGTHSSATIRAESWRGDLIVALTEIAELRKRYTKKKALLSIHCQLSYLVALADGVEDNDSALEEITIGYLADHKLAGILSVQLAQLLGDIDMRVERYLFQRGRNKKDH